MAVKVGIMASVALAGRYFRTSIGDPDIARASTISDTKLPIC